MLAERGARAGNWLGVARTCTRGLARLRGVAVRGVIGRAVVLVAAVVGLLGVPVGVASAGAGPAVLAFERSQYAYGLVSIGAGRSGCSRWSTAAGGPRAP